MILDDSYFLNKLFEKSETKKIPEVLYIFVGLLFLLLFFTHAVVSGVEQRRHSATLRKMEVLSKNFDIDDMLKENWAKGEVVDAWGRPFQIKEISDKHVEFFSLGANVHDPKDDIKVVFDERVAETSPEIEKFRVAQKELIKKKLAEDVQENKSPKSDAVNLFKKIFPN